MRTRRSRIKLAIVLVILTSLFALVWNPLSQSFRVAALRQTVENQAELFLGSSEQPYRLVRWLDSAAESLTTRFASKDKALTERIEGYRKQFRFLFREPIDQISLAGPFKEDPGHVLARFPRLRSLVIFEQDKAIPESQWAQLCAGLRKCPVLEEVILGGAELRDSAIAPLEGQPTLRVIAVPQGRLTRACAATVRAMPNVKELYLGNSYPFESGVMTLDEFNATAAALPKIAVKMY